MLLCCDHVQRLDGATAERRLLSYGCKNEYGRKLQKSVVFRGGFCVNVESVLDPTLGMEFDVSSFNFNPKHSSRTDPEISFY